MPIEHSHAYLGAFITLFAAWGAIEILERQFGLAPVIRRQTSIQQKSVVQRLTRQLDEQGRFRIQTRGTVYFIKATWCLCLWITMIYTFFSRINERNWYYRHFIALDPETMQYQPYQFICGSILVFYPWEMSVNRYAKFGISVAVHHWLTSLAALLILLGGFNPFATWYGATAVASVFPIFTFLGIRGSQYAFKFPNLTRHGFSFCFGYYLLIMILNMSGQLYLIIHGIMTKKIEWYKILIICIAICGWMYDDIQLLRSLLDFATHNYEDAELYAKAKTTRAITGRVHAVRFEVDLEDDTDKDKNKDKSKSRDENELTIRDVLDMVEAHVSNKNRNKSPLEESQIKSIHEEKLEPMSPTNASLKQSVEMALETALGKHVEINQEINQENPNPDPSKNI